MDAQAENQREVLRQAGVALQGRVVTLWEVSPTIGVAPLASGVPNAPDHATRLNLDTTLRQWGVSEPLVPKSPLSETQIVRWNALPSSRVKLFFSTSPIFFATFNFPIGVQQLPRLSPHPNLEVETP